MGFAALSQEPFDQPNRRERTHTNAMAAPLRRIAQTGLPPALNDSDNDNYDRHDQEYVNESANGVRGNQTQKPQNDKDDRDGFEHVCLQLRPGAFNLTLRLA